MNKQIEQLFKRHYRKMYLLAKVLLRDGDAAKDAVSDVFADMLDNNATVDSETAESFLLVCVRNKCLNTLDREKTRERAMTFIAGETESTEEAPERLAKQRRIALKQLPAAQKNSNMPHLRKQKPTATQPNPPRREHS